LLSHCYPIVIPLLSYCYPIVPIVSGKQGSQAFTEEQYKKAEATIGKVRT
jgi:hypothetical protein